MSGHPRRGQVLCEEGGDRSGVEGAGEDEALATVAALLLEALVLVALLDALGERLEVQRLAEADERVDELARGPRLGDRPDEGLVDLQRVDREPPEVGE